MALDFVVANGATLNCTFGSVSSSLIVATSKAKAESKNVGVISDKIVGTFGTCSALGPGPCVPAIPGNWTPGCTKLNNTAKAFIKKSDTLVCTVGGIISISNANQVKVKAE